jgi:hypothetical protein
MAKAKQVSKRKCGKTALALGAAGVSMTMTGGASATGSATVPSQDDAQRFILGEEEISDVSLATFQVFDRENPAVGQNIRIAAGCRGCGGCAGCAHAAGCAGCAHAVACAVGAARPVTCAVGTRCAVGVHCAVGGRCRCACRGCTGGCACGGVWIGVACLGCGGCSGTCWQWDPWLGQWVYVCY